MIIHPEQLVETVSRISCGDEHGSGFFISLTRLLTARHVIVDHLTDGCEITLSLTVMGQDAFLILPASLIDENEDLDVAILEIAGQRPTEDFLPVTFDYIRYNEEWDTFGYPFTKLAEGQHLSGTVLALIRNLPYDISLISDDIDTNLNYSGLSGSPLIIFGKVCGIVTWSTVRGLGAISIKKIIDFLTKNEIAVEDNIDSTWSKDFITEIDRAVKNDDVTEKLRAAVTSGGSYYLLHGSPGAGKSMIASTIDFGKNTIKVIGRYLIRIPGDSMPIYVKASRENFMQWVEDLVSKTLTGEPAAKDTLAWNERVTRLSVWLNQLNDYYSAKDEIAVIVVDGLDELLIDGRNGTKDFLSVFPETLPSHLTVLLSCTSSEILPVNISSKFTDEQKIHVTPLSQVAAAKFIHQENEILNLGLTLTQETLVAQKSEGHPLYLRYLIQTLKNNAPTDTDIWITTLPTIDGDIKNYYEALWAAQIATDADKYWIALIGSQLREAVSIDEFKSMLPDGAAYQFQVKFEGIKHLFKQGSKVSIYHNSFESFITQKGASDIKSANQYISDFNISAQQSIYALKNLLHHLLLSNDPIPTIAYCNQQWSDKCALVHMEPDRIIDDIRRVEMLCIAEAAAAELIRIKLLLQRLRFRYNNVLAKHAFAITDALIQMGNSRDAIKYILRGNLLLVSLDNAIYFLQKLYETGANQEALLLFQAIDIRFKAMLESAGDGGGIDLQMFVYNLQALTLSINTKPFAEVMPQFMSGMHVLKNAQDNTEIPADQKEHIRELRDYISAWNLGYFIYRFNSYPGIEKMAEISPAVYSAKSAQHLAKAAISYHHFKETGNLTLQDENAYLRLTADIEKLITDYGYQDEDTDLLIKTLIEESQDPTLIAGIINKHLANRMQFSFRKTNGVDADFDSFIELFNEKTYEGYIDTTNVFPLLKTMSATSWEPFFKSAFELAGFITGKAYRLRAEGKLQDILALETKSEELLSKLSFTLLDRVKLDRSYLLIEEILPLLYQRLMSFYVDFQPASLSWLVGHLIKAPEQQLGQYTEGYRRSLAAMSKKLAGYPNQKQHAFKLIQVLEQHTNVAVQNRWQRTPELIEIVNLYAKIGAKSKAKDVYQQMLDTSMGPSWYKEDQLVLVNSVLRKMNIDKADEHTVDFAAYLEFASGEMTFQRYVQSEIHGFIGTLAKLGHISKAVDYFKFQLLPTPDTILANAEASVIDAPLKGDGYVLGARSIIEPSAMLQLLETVTVDPFLVISLTEVFLINSDTERYLDDFTELQYKGFQNAMVISDTIAERVLQRIAQIVLSHRLNEERTKYVYRLAKAFGEDAERLQQILLAAGLPADNLPEKEQPKPKKMKQEYSEEEDAKMVEYGLPFPGVGKMSNFAKIDEAIRLAEIEFTLENNDEGRRLLIDCLALLQDGEADVWQGKNLTSELGTLFDSLKNHSSATEIIHSLKNLIHEHLTDDWRVANFLMSLLQNKLPDDEKEKIILAVKEHIETLIRSNGTFRTKYEWLAHEGAELNQDIQLTNFLVWLLNHPYHSVQTVVIDTIQWLSSVKPELIIPVLIEYAVVEGFEMVNELSAYLLTIISANQPTEFWAILKNFPSFRERVLNLRHTMMRVYWRDTLAVISTLDVVALELSESVNVGFPAENVVGSDVYLEHFSLRPVEDIIEELNGMEILNRAFCEGLMENVTEFAKPLVPVDRLRVERYIGRSFFEEDIVTGHYEYFLRSAINITLNGRVGNAQIAEVKTILELPVI